MTNIYQVFQEVSKRSILYADIQGTKKYPNIKGTLAFYESVNGYWVAIHIEGLPVMNKKCVSPFFGCHIHEGNKCSGNEEDLLADTLGHYDPFNCPHPMHLGDLLPLYSRDGKVDMYYRISGIDVRQFMGRTLVIHAHRDDLTSQPSGDSGEKIACGVLVSS